MKLHGRKGLKSWGRLPICRFIGRLNLPTISNNNYSASVADGFKKGLDPHRDPRGSDGE